MDYLPWMPKYLGCSWLFMPWLVAGTGGLFTAVPQEAMCFFAGPVQRFSQNQSQYSLPGGGYVRFSSACRNSNRIISSITECKGHTKLQQEKIMEMHYYYIYLLDLKWHKVVEKQANNLQWKHAVIDRFSICVCVCMCVCVFYLSIIVSKYSI